MIEHINDLSKGVRQKQKEELCKQQKYTDCLGVRLGFRAGFNFLGACDFVSSHVYHDCKCANSEYPGPEQALTPDASGQGPGIQAWAELPTTGLTWKTKTWKPKDGFTALNVLLKRQFCNFVILCNGVPGKAVEIVAGTQRKTATQVVILNMVENGQTIVTFSKMRETKFVLWFRINTFLCFSHE